METMLTMIRHAKGPRAEKEKAKKAFLAERDTLYSRIMDGAITGPYISHDGKRYTHGSRGTALLCDFILANRAALGVRAHTDPLARRAQKEILFRVLLGRHKRPDLKGDKFYCCPRCTGKFRECLRANAFHYIDNKEWLAMTYAP